MPQRGVHKNGMHRNLVPVLGHTANVYERSPARIIGNCGP
jgi:hypothetical protein